MTPEARNFTGDVSRQLRLRELMVLDTPPEAVFDSLARLASEICGTPIALLTLVDENRVWVKAGIGLPGVTEMPRALSLCEHAIGNDSVFEVPDASVDPLFANNSQVTGAPYIRFYAGAPLVLPCGERIGTLSVIDRQARSLDAAQAKMLRSLADLASQALVMRRDLMVEAMSARSDCENALRASQEFLYRTGRVAGVNGWELDLPSEAVTWSEETRRIHEVAADYVPSRKDVLGFYSPEARKVVEHAVLGGLERGETWDLELPFVTGAGRHLWVRAVGAVEFENGKPRRMVGAFQDITDRKRLQQELTDSERFVRQITDSLQVRIAYIDRERRYRFVNLVHCKRYGLSREQILGRTRSELTGGHTDAVVEPHMAAVLAGQVRRFEYEERVDGALRRIETELIPDVTETGEVRGIYATGVDITERSAVENRLRVLTAILDKTPDAVVQSDSNGAITYMNPAARRGVGLSPDEPVERRKVTEFATLATLRHFVRVIEPAVKAGGVWIGETTVFGVDRREVPVNHIVIAHRGLTGNVHHYSAVMRDISAEHQARQQVQRQTATLRSVAEAIPALVAVVGSDGCFRFVNRGFELWHGVTREKVIGRTVHDVIGEVEFERSRPWLERVLAGETVHFEKYYSARISVCYLDITFIPLRLESGTLDGFVVVTQDITQHKQEEERLLQLTQRDALTGLLNRAGFDAQLARRLCEGGGPTLALLYIDLDHFKRVNDQHGHPVGDQVLQLFSQRLLRLVRPTDAVARLGGDEFVVLMSGVRENANSHAVADKIIAAAASPFEVGRHLLQVGASVGIAFGSDPVFGCNDLIGRADTRLYQAKESGRGRQAGAAG